MKVAYLINFFTLAPVSFSLSLLIFVYYAWIMAYIASINLFSPFDAWKMGNKFVFYISFEWLHSSLLAILFIFYSVFLSLSPFTLDLCLNAIVLYYSWVFILLYFDMITVDKTIYYIYVPVANGSYVQLPYALLLLFFSISRVNLQVFIIFFQVFVVESLLDFLNQLSLTMYWMVRDNVFSIAVISICNF